MALNTHDNNPFFTERERNFSSHLSISTINSCQEYKDLIHIHTKENYQTNRDYHEKIKNDVITLMNKKIEYYGDTYLKTVFLNGNIDDILYFMRN